MDTDTEMGSPPAPTGKRRGCFFYGCLTVLVLIVVTGVGAYFFIQWLSGLIEQYTSEEPLKLPVVAVSAADLEKLEDRWETFERGMEANEAVEPLELTAKEINTLIQNDPEWKDLKGRLYVEIDEQDRVHGQVSIPLGDLDVGRLKGRYLNGSATLNVSMESGVLVVKVTSVEVKGESLPDAVLEGLLDRNLARGLYDDPKAAKVLRRLDKVEVKDGKVRITPRAAE